MFNLYPVFIHRLQYMYSVYMREIRCLERVVFAVYLTNPWAHKGQIKEDQEKKGEGGSGDEKKRK